MVVYFREVQRLRWTRVILLFAVIPLYGLYKQSVRGQPFGNHPAPNGVLYAALGFILALWLWLSLAKLIIEVRDDVLFVRFFLLWPTTDIPWAEIDRAEAVTYRPMRDYGGWGVRWGRAGMAYSVSGHEGVLVRLRHGEDIMLGSRRAGELARAIAVKIRS